MTRWLSAGGVRKLGSRLGTWYGFWRKLFRLDSQFGSYSLNRRVLAVNMLPLAVLGAGLLFLDRYETSLIDNELNGLTREAGVFAAALAEGAVLRDPGEEPELVKALSQGMMRELVQPTGLRGQLFLSDGTLIADSRTLIYDSQNKIQIIDLPPLDEDGLGLISAAAAGLSSLLRTTVDREPYFEPANPSSVDFPEVLSALDGRKATAVRSDGDGFVLMVAVPVTTYRQVLGAILLSSGSANIERQVNSVRKDILELFSGALVMTALLSLYLASTIARPVRRLAEAARVVRRGQGRLVDVPDFGRRRDEIGELSIALREMTEAIWHRMDAIERFAADVSHEIKNPLTSLRSAVETAVRIPDPDKQRRLMAVILDDVQRLDRLITDISQASRLDAEMSRLERKPVSITGMLQTLVSIHESTHETDDPPAPSLIFTPPLLTTGLPDPLIVSGKEGRLVQVFQNLISNALSFSPPDGAIRVSAERLGGKVLIRVDDDGPGIPVGKCAAIFERFYTERPSGEKFGTHSGLGLSISKQIIDAHGGRIWAENRGDDPQAPSGARFCVELDRADPGA